jgi:hypothetical protein
VLRRAAGPLTAEGWQVEAAVKAGNTRTDSAHNRYQIAPIELVKIERDARRQGLGIAGFYHSHPDHPAQWSPPTWPKPTGWAALTSSPPSRRATRRHQLVSAGRRDGRRQALRAGTIEVNE